MVKVLVVDDDVVIRDLLSEILSRWGWEVVCVDNGRKGLDKYQEEDFTLLISDVRMPVMDGLTMLENIRVKDKRIPIIIITAYPSVDSAVESLDKGADYYLVKPINMNDLKAKVNKCLEKITIQKKINRLQALNRIILMLLPVAIIAGYLLSKLF